MARVIDTDGVQHNLREFLPDDIDAVRYDTNAQGLSYAQMLNARTNIGACTKGEAQTFNTNLTKSGLQAVDGYINIGDATGGYVKFGNLVIVQFACNLLQSISDYATSHAICKGFPLPSNDFAALSLVSQSSIGVAQIRKENGVGVLRVENIYSGVTMSGAVVVTGIYIDNTYV